MGRRRAGEIFYAEFVGDRSVILPAFSVFSERFALKGAAETGIMRNAPVAQTDRATAF